MICSIDNIFQLIIYFAKSHLSQILQINKFFNDHIKYLFFFKMSEIAKDEYQKLQIKILSNPNSSEELENEIFQLIEQATLKSTSEASLANCLLLTYINYSKLSDKFPKEFTKFLVKLLESDQIAIQEMSFILISSLIKREELKTVFDLIAAQFQSINNGGFILFLSFAFDFEPPLNDLWESLIEPAKKLFDTPGYEKKAHKFVDYMQRIKDRKQEIKKIHAHHKVPASKFTPDFVDQDSDTVRQYINMLPDEDWQIQLKAVDGINNTIDLHPDLLQNNAKTVLLNLMDAINSPRTKVKSSSLKLALKIIDKFPEKIAAHSGKYAEIAFDLCGYEIDFIAKDANEFLTLLATKVPRVFVLHDFATRSHDEEPIIRANAARCFALMIDMIDKDPVPVTIGEKEHFIGGPLNDHEFRVFIKSNYQLIRDKEELARTESRKVMKKLIEDPRFPEVSHQIILDNDDYDMIMSDLAKY